MRKFLIIFLVIGVPVILSILVLSSTDETPHDFTDKCTGCHLTSPEGNGSKKLIFIKDISVLCSECHNFGELATHPVGMKPSMEVPDDLHLDWQGKLTCATCHDPHKEMSLAVSGEKSYLLRRYPPGMFFCLACHKNPSKTLTLEHAISMETVHVGNKYVVKNPDFPIDDYSMKCISCHDGSIGREVSNLVVGLGDWEHKPIVAINHPIGIDYADAALGNRKLKSPEELNPNIKLFGGKVGCGSCHNPFSKHGAQLTVTIFKSELCFECHNK